MAKELVSGNLNQYGNFGQFESDRSTWGFADNDMTWSRSADFASAGMYAAKGVLGGGGFSSSAIMQCAWLGTIGHKYIIKAKLRTPTGNALGSGADKFNFRASLSNLFFGLTEVDYTEKTVTETLDAWTEVEISVEATGAPLGAYYGLSLCAVMVGVPGGLLYVDEFTVHRYVDVEDPEEPEPEPEFPQIEGVVFSRNPVTLPKAATAGWDEADNFRLYDDVRVEDVADSGTFVSKLTQALPPDADGNVVFQVREAFRDVVKAVPPTLNQATIARLTDRVKRFKHYTGELQDDEVTPGTLTASDVYLVLLGGLSKFAWASINFFATYLPANKKFLTWAPLEKQVDRTQEDYLNYLVFDATTAQLKLRLKVYFDDGTNSTSTILTQSAVVQWNLYQLPAGPANTGVLLINPAKTVTKYELWLEDQDDEVISEVRTYLLDLFTHPRRRVFMFLNSLGAYETLRFTGQAELTTEFVKDGMVKFLPYNYAALDGEKETNHATLQEGGSYSTGYAASAAWHEYLKDFLLSRRVYDVTDGKRRPVQVQGGGFATGADQVYERYIRFTAVSSYEDENFTPANV